MKVLKLKARNIVVNQNEDGTLRLTQNGKPIDNAGSVIVSLGGIDGVLARCEEMSEEELIAPETLRKRQAQEKQARILQRKQEEEKRARAAYEEVFGGQDVVESSPRNISRLLYYINAVGYIDIPLPAMSIGYRIHFYDCEGTLVTAITLDSPVSYMGGLVCKFKTPSPRGHLEKYCVIREL